MSSSTMASPVGEARRPASREHGTESGSCFPQDGEGLEWLKRYPFQPRSVSIAGCRYHYVDEFTGSRPAATLLFVHGNPTWSFHWRELIGGHRADYRCIAVDHLGCGFSERPRAPLRLADHMDNLTELVDALDLENVTLVAQDWGGAIGLGTLLRRRERFSRIVLFNTGAFRPWFIPWRIRVCRTPFIGRPAVQGANLFVRAALRMTLARKRRLDPAIRAGYLAPYENWADRRAVYDFVEDIPSSPRHPTWRVLEEIERDLASLDDLPILLTWGMRDWCFTPACLDKFCDFWPQAEVHPIADAGHWVVEDAADEVRAVMSEFLAATVGPAMPAGTGADLIKLSAWGQSEAEPPVESRADTCTDRRTEPSISVPAGTADPTVRTCAWLACLLEATAAKPGNVHPGAAFEDLCYDDFVASGRAISGIMQHAPSLGVGRSVYLAVRAMRAAARGNAHLGTILLLAPLACVPAGVPLRRGVEELLPMLDAKHTQQVYDAIRLAAPGGLGEPGQGDVYGDAPKAPLAEVMSWASERDLVAAQYANGFATVFATAEKLSATLPNGSDSDGEKVPDTFSATFSAIVHVHVELLAAHGDSLIARKCGPATSEEAQRRAGEVLAAGPIGSPAYRQQLEELDAWLRADGHRRNPGTSADILAAALFVLLRQGRLDPTALSATLAASVGSARPAGTNPIAAKHSSPTPSAQP